MTMDIYGTRFLAGLIETIPPEVNGFWLNFFTRLFNFETEEIFFDKVRMDRRMAAFCMPTVEGRPQKERGFSTDRFKPAYVKPRDIVNPSRVIPRMPGESLNGQLSLQSRAERLIVSYMAEQRSMIDRRIDWMAARALLDGQVVVEGEDYPAITVDFGRKASHDATLGAGSRWGDAGVKPLDNLETWRGMVGDDSGFKADVQIFGSQAWKAFRQDTDLKALLDLRRGGGLDQLGSLSILPGSGAPLEYKGNDGTCDYFVYNGKYDSPDADTQVAIMDPRDVLVVASAGVAGAQCYGAIMDMMSLQAVKYFPKSWVTENPSARHVMTQSAPLMVPGRPDATLRRRVVA